MFTIFSTIAAYFVSNWKSIVGILVLVVLLFGGIGYFVYDYSQAKQQLAEQKAAADKWKSNYQQAEEANRENQEKIERLQKEAIKVQRLLQEKEQFINSVNETIKQKEDRIDQLEKNYAEVRAALDYSIPCKLWIEIFPSSSLCPDKNSH